MTAKPDPKEGLAFLPSHVKLVKHSQRQIDYRGPDDKQHVYGRICCVRVQGEVWQNKFFSRPLTVFPFPTIDQSTRPGPSSPNKNSKFCANSSVGRITGWHETRRNRTANSQESRSSVAILLNVDNFSRTCLFIKFLLIKVTKRSRSYLLEAARSHVHRFIILYKYSVHFSYSRARGPVPERIYIYTAF